MEHHEFQLIVFDGSSGWLGIIVGSKLYINYAKKTFDAAYSETLTELRAAISRSERKTVVTLPAKGSLFLI
jgi:hypothetical protein